MFRVSEEEEKVLSHYGIPKICWFLFRSSSITGEQYIGIGKYGSPSFHQYGVWYRESTQKNKKILNATYINMNGKKIKVEWPSITISYSDEKNLNLSVLKRAIESGWLTCDELLESQDFEAAESIVDQFDWNLDGRSMSTYRKEQDELRSHLLSGLDFCGELYPADMLWASHIKKRSECAPFEKADLNNIAVLMCKLGCDDLYEKGYMGVNKGVVKPIRQVSGNALKKRVKELEGMPCRYWNEGNATYFNRHWDYWHKCLN